MITAESSPEQVAEWLQTVKQGSFASLVPIFGIYKGWILLNLTKEGLKGQLEDKIMAASFFNILHPEEQGNPLRFYLLFLSCFHHTSFHFVFLLLYVIFAHSIHKSLCCYNNYFLLFAHSWLFRKTQDSTKDLLEENVWTGISRGTSWYIFTRIA